MPSEPQSDESPSTQCGADSQTKSEQTQGADQRASNVFDRMSENVNRVLKENAKQPFKKIQVGKMGSKRKKKNRSETDSKRESRAKERRRGSEGNPVMGHTDIGLSKSEVLTNIQIPNYSNYSFRSNDIRANLVSESCSGSHISNSLYLTECQPSLPLDQSAPFFLQHKKTSLASNVNGTFPDYASHLDFSKTDKHISEETIAITTSAFYSNKKGYSDRKQKPVYFKHDRRKLSNQMPNKKPTANRHQMSRANQTEMLDLRRPGKCKPLNKASPFTQSNEENGHFNLDRVTKPVITFARAKHSILRADVSATKVKKTNSFPRKRLKQVYPKLFARGNSKTAGNRALNFKRNRASRSTKKPRKKRQKNGSLGASGLGRSSGSIENKFSFRFSEIKEKRRESSSINSSAVHIGKSSEGPEKQVNIQDFIRKLNSQRVKTKPSQTTPKKPKKNQTKSVPFGTVPGKSGRSKERPKGLTRSTLKTKSKPKPNISFRNGYTSLKRKILFNRRSNLFLKRRTNNVRKENSQTQQEGLFREKQSGKSYCGFSNNSRYFYKSDSNVLNELLFNEGKRSRN